MMLSDTLTNSSNSFLKLKREGSCIVHFQTKAPIIAFVDFQLKTHNSEILPYTLKLSALLLNF